MAALFIPPFKEILDIVKSFGDLSSNDNAKLLRSNIIKSEFYKELYKAIDNLEPGVYSFFIGFYTIGPNPNLSLPYFNVCLNNNLTVMDQRFTNMGYLF